MKRGNYKVLTWDGKHDIIPGKFLEYYIRIGYVLAVLD